MSYATQAILSRSRDRDGKASDETPNGGAESTRDSAGGIFSEIPEESDTREKLEKDVCWQMDHFLAWDGKRYEFTGYVLEWLDRQAAITKQEYYRSRISPLEEAMHVLEREKAELQSKLDELKTLTSVQGARIHALEDGYDENSCRPCFDEMQRQRTAVAERYYKALDKVCELQANVDEQEKMLADSRELFSDMRKQRDEVYAKWAKLIDERDRYKTVIESDREQHEETLRENRELCDENKALNDERGELTRRVKELENDLKNMTGARDYWKLKCEHQPAMIVGQLREMLTERMEEGE